MWSPSMDRWWRWSWSWSSPSLFALLGVFWCTFTRAAVDLVDNPQRVFDAIPPFSLFSELPEPLTKVLYALCVVFCSASFFLFHYCIFFSSQQYFYVDWNATHTIPFLLQGATTVLQCSCSDGEVQLYFPMCEAASWFCGRLNATSQCLIYHDEAVYSNIF